MIKKKYMKKLILVLLLATTFVSCQKETAERQIVIQEPAIEITNTRKVYAGSNPSVLITYTITNSKEIKSLRLNNILPAPFKEGTNTLNDPNNGQTNNAFYYWVIDKTDGTQKFTQPMQYFF